MKAKYTASHDRLTLNVTDAARQNVRVTVSRGGKRVTATVGVGQALYNTITKKIFDRLAAGENYEAAMLKIESIGKDAADWSSFAAAL